MYKRQANNVTIRAKFLVARGITEQVLLSCDDLINILIVHKEFPNRTLTCRSCIDVGRQDKAYTGCREEQKKGRPQTLHEIQKGAESCNTDANTEENKIRHPDGNTARSTITNVQEDESRSQRRTHRGVSRDAQ